MPDKIQVMVNGLPGKMATLVAERVLQEKDMKLFPFSLTGQDIELSYVDIGKNGSFVSLVKPMDRETEGKCFYKSFKGIIGVDYIADPSNPNAVNANVEFYCRNGLNSVVGSTGGDRKALEERAKNSKIVILPASNMAAPVVALQEFIQDFANENPRLFKGYKIETKESHQEKKSDPSGTAIAISKSWAKLGIEGMPYDVRDVEAIKSSYPKPLVDRFGNSFRMIRNPEEQKEIGVPEEFLSGHGWHTYTIEAPYDQGNNLEHLKHAFSQFFVEGASAFEGYKISNEHPVIGAISPDKNVLLRMWDTGDDSLEITHNINGRSVYVDGTMQAIRFLDRKVRAGERGKVYSMIDVLTEV